ncbi:MAG: hypothetical protein CMF29_03070 [Kiritimatiellaceae bacterium]|nr:hypothetical protein [Kiritimatiellaceae bacterium]
MFYFDTRFPNRMAYGILHAMENNDNNRGRLSITIHPENRQPVYNWLEDNFSISPVETQRPQSPILQLDAYFETLLHAQIALQVLPATLPILHAEANELRAEEWTTFWQHHFKIEEIGRNLRIVPYWEDPPEDQRKNLIINPGLSFGTGGHFTTRFCLEQLEIAIQQKQPKSILDAGSGSGILSIAADKLGIEHIHAFDLDPVSIEQADANASRNRSPISFKTADLLNEDFYLPSADLICANILTGVLLQAAPKLIQATNLRLILSGIREIEADAVADTFIQYGAQEVSRDGDGEWCGIVLDKYLKRSPY